MTNEIENIILLSGDALRADHLSCYGYHRNTSPFLNEFAESNLLFTNAYSASSHTREAVPALLTGEYPDVAISSDYRLATDTVASTLSSKGFRTAGFHSNPFVSRAYGFDEGFETFDDDLHLGQHKFIALAQRAFDKLRNRHYARADEINERSLDWIDSLDSQDSFFLWNHYMDTHGPYEPPDEYATLYRDDRLPNKDAQSLYQRAIKDPDSITDAEREVLIDLYDAEIRYNDDQIREFIASLRERDILENSLLVFTADHGDAFGENGYYEHPRYLHNELTHVPLIIHHPDINSEVIDVPVSTLNIVSTFENVVGNEASFSLLDGPEEDRAVFSQARGEDNHAHLRRYALRTASGTSFCERNRETGEIDFAESVDRSLREKLRTHVEERVAVENGEETEERDDEASEEIEQRLQALGYKE